MYRRYVDDVTVVLYIINLGWYYCAKSNLMKFDLTKADINEDDESRTMRILKEIADTLNPNVQFTVDHPSNNSDNKMPVLDLKMWIQDTPEGPQVMHTFYKKVVSSPFTILKRSAMGAGTKRNTMFQEGWRRINNISPNLPWSESIIHLNSFSNMLRVSGYSPEFRHHTIRGVISRMKQVKEMVSTGEWTSHYRDRKAITEAKKSKGGNSASTWFLKGLTTATTTCMATPGSTLQLAIRAKLAEGQQADGGRTMVLEDGGLPATLGLKLRNPFRALQCTFGDPNCMVSPSTDCSLQDKVYIITCNECLDEVTTGTTNTLPIILKPTRPGGEARLNYVGTTGTSMHARSILHLKSIKAKDQSNALANHIRLAHGDIQTTFTMSLMSSHRTVLNRFKTEAVYIEKQVVGSSLNQKREGGRGGLVRIGTQVDRC